MKSFALATAFLLVIASSAIANPVPEGPVADDVIPKDTPMHLVTALKDGLVLSLQPSLTPGESLIFATRPKPGQYLQSTFVLSLGTDNGYGLIKFYNASGPGTLCVMAPSSGGSVPTATTCDESDFYQHWAVGGNGAGPVPTVQGNCLAYDGPNPQEGDQLRVIECKDDEKGQLWTAVLA